MVVRPLNVAVSYVDDEKLGEKGVSARIRDGKKAAVPLGFISNYRYVSIMIIPLVPGTSIKSV